MLCFARFLLIALMLVLLPARGWTGDIMAVNMAANTLAQARVGSSATQASMPADCAMHTQPVTEDAAAFCGSCDTCELCLAIANLTPASWPAGQFTRHSSPITIDTSFSSANSASSLKPPIS